MIFLRKNYPVTQLKRNFAAMNETTLYIALLAAGASKLEYIEEPSEETMINVTESLRPFYTKLGFSDVNKWIAGYEFKNAYMYTGNMIGREIYDRFLYCSNSSGWTGGSKTIAIKNLPAHNHNITQLCVRGNDNGSNQYTVATYGGKDLTITTENTGDGQDYMPPYITVYAWYRTA